MLTLYEKAELFRSYHHGYQILILPNAWDALSAKLFEQAGAKAIGTSSAGIAACLGYADGEYVPLDLFYSLVERIIKVVNIPVTVDIESGMGASNEAICENIHRIIEIGAVGINIEDSYPQQHSLIPISEQVEKITAIKSLVNKISIPIFINARVDTYWLGLPENTNSRYTETLQRMWAYRDAGADGVFVPGLTRLDVIKDLCNSINIPFNVLSGSWLPLLSELSLSGVARLSTGSNPIRSIGKITSIMAVEILNTGKSEFFANAIPYDEMNHLYNKTI